MIHRPEASPLTVVCIQLSLFAIVGVGALSFFTINWLKGKITMSKGMFAGLATVLALLGCIGVFWIFKRRPGEQDVQSYTHLFYGVPLAVATALLVILLCIKPIQWLEAEPVRVEQIAQAALPVLADATELLPPFTAVPTSEGVSMNLQGILTAISALEQLAQPLVSLLNAFHPNDTGSQAKINTALAISNAALSSVGVAAETFESLKPAIVSAVTAPAVAPSALAPGAVATEIAQGASAAAGQVNTLTVTDNGAQGTASAAQQG